MTTNWRTVQERLKALGFDPGYIDGVRGPKTDAAIIAFKRSVGLRPRAYFGPITEAALMGGAQQRARADIPWMAEASRMLGLHEGRNTATLRKWFDASVSWIDPREIPWCGAFVATCIRAALPGETLPENPLGARAWGGFGASCDPVFGAVLTFWRGSRAGWQGHVGFYWGEDDDAYHVLGGNQTDAVTTTRIAKGRLLQARWPEGLPVTGRPILLSAAGTPLSHNEA
ncbi:peptidoglycan-binding protein [Rhodobacter sp. TJ_12]|uniref:NlpC/P60 family protein n=1 Tax=Rhodobacter sp. TJ_12 TaxID=2029399 RepID=UPI001CBDF8F7|nr:TIGR02594 family protein [Rhodobacter sp. TJ_12]MBZ4024127.1 peptidoglycan-binding protein [Rhodobacter sp. TJ_12]